MADPHWYAVDSSGVATLCVDEADAIKEAADAALVYPQCAPYRATQLIPARDYRKLLEIVEIVAAGNTEYAVLQQQAQTALAQEGS